MTCETAKDVQLSGVRFTIFCQDTEEDAVNPNLFDEDFSPAVYAIYMNQHRSWLVTQSVHYNF